MQVWGQFLEKYALNCFFPVFQAGELPNYAISIELPPAQARLLTDE
jgi:hypothetical protein